MALLKYFTAEGGTNGNTVNAADTGSGDTPTTVNSTNGTNRYSTAQSVVGTKSVELASGGVAGTINDIWTHASNTSATYRWYMLTPSSFSTVPSFARIRSGSTQNLRMRFDSSGHAQILDTASANAVTSTDAMSTSTWYRCELQVTPGSANNTGAASFKFWPLSADTGNADAGKTITTSGKDYGSTNAVAEFGWGWFTSIANVPSIFFDAFASQSGTGTDIGPAIRSIDGTLTVTATLTGTDSVDHNASGTLTVTATNTGSATVDHAASGTLTVTAGLTGAGAVDHVADGSLAVTATLAGTAAATRSVDGNLTATATLTATAAVDIQASGDLAVLATLVGAATVGVTPHGVGQLQVAATSARKLRSASRALVLATQTREVS